MAKKNLDKMTGKEMIEEFLEFKKKVDNIYENVDEIMQKVNETDDPEITAYMAGVVFAKTAVTAGIDAVTFLTKCMAIYKKLGGSEPTEEMKRQLKKLADSVTSESQSPDGEEKKWLH